MSRVVTFGEIMLRLSTPGHQRFVQTNSFDASFGGSEANVAATLAGFEIESEFVTRLPENEIGQAAINELRRFGVDTKHILRGGERTGIYFLEPGYSQRPSKVIYDRKNSAVSELKPGMIDWDDIFENADWFHWSGITPALGDNLAEIVKNAAATAQKHGLTVSCDLNYRNKLWTTEQARLVMNPLMENVDVCIANIGAARDCLGVVVDNESGGDSDEEFELAKTLKSEYDFQSVALTSRNSLSASRNIWSAVFLDDKECKNPVRSAEYDILIIDRVGGGDSFAGALIYGLLKLSNSIDALEFATAASCLKLTVRGDFNLVTVSEVEAVIKSGGTGRVDR